MMEFKNGVQRAGTVGQKYTKKRWKQNSETCKTGKYPEFTA